MRIKDMKEIGVLLLSFSRSQVCIRKRRTKLRIPFFLLSFTYKNPLWKGGTVLLPPLLFSRFFFLS